jgi:hypothetical protein
VSAAHLLRASLEAYVAFELTEGDAALVEAHAGECAVCASRLAAAARLEVAFEAIANAGEAGRRGRRGRSARASAALCAGLAVAASAVLLLAPRSHAGEGERAFEAPASALADATSAVSDSCAFDAAAPRTRD